MSFLKCDQELMKDFINVLSYITWILVPQCICFPTAFV